MKTNAREILKPFWSNLGFATTTVRGQQSGLVVRVVNMQTSLRGIANRAKTARKALFRNLYGLLNEENLRWCFRQLRRSAATRVDGVSFDDYPKSPPSTPSQLRGS